MYMYTQFRTWEWEELHVHVATEKWLGWRQGSPPLVGGTEVRKWSD